MVTEQPVARLYAHWRIIDRAVALEPDACREHQPETVSDTIRAALRGS